MKGIVAVGIIIALLIGGGLGYVVGQSVQQPASVKTGISPSAMNLTLGMRKLWEDHVTWTRVYIISAVDGLNDTSAAATRLLKNQDDIGNAIKPYYGNDAGNQLTTLLKTHITTAVALIAAAKAGNTTAFEAANTSWYANANDIATFLSNANPNNWPKSVVLAMMYSHLNLTTIEVVKRLTHDYPGDVVAYDNVVNEILMMSDALSNGIIQQFPNQFT